jgi:uncharacterized repeat protein (TIGR03803 family)
MIALCLHIPAWAANTTVYNFSDKDGAFPYAPLLMTNGDLYGTTLVDGANNDGSVFEITSWAESADSASEIAC